MTADEMDALRRHIVDRESIEGYLALGYRLQVDTPHWVFYSPEGAPYATVDRAAAEYVMRSEAVMTKNKPTRMEKPAPAVDDDAPAVVVQQRDPRLCACVDVQRRYDGDGLAEQADGVNYYRCAACGKLYA